MTDVNTYNELFRKARREYAQDGVVHADTLARAAEAGIMTSTLIADVTE